MSLTSEINCGRNISRMSNINGDSCETFYEQLFKLGPFDNADMSKMILTFVVVLSFLIKRDGVESNAFPKRPLPH